jgi:colanic acid/amylovoran biosynthesis protein
MTRILITNVYSYKNKGDAAIVLALLQEIERVFSNSKVLIQTADVRHDYQKYGPPVTDSLLWILLSSVRDKSLAVRLMRLVGGVLGLSVYLCIAKWLKVSPSFLLSKQLKQFVHENQRADLAIACGGGYLRTATSSLRDTILLSVTCLNFLTAKFLGKPVYLYSQSIGPLYSGLQRKIVKFSLNHVDLIEPREAFSLAFLQELGLRSPILPTADAALLLGQRGRWPATVTLNRNRIHVGITVRKWFKDAESLDKYVEAFAQTIDYLITQHNAQVFYIPQVIAENFGDDDRLVAERVQASVSEKKHFMLVTDDLHPFEVIGLCGKMDIFIGTRMHSNIFALINYVPVIAIEYEHKTRGIMQGLGLEALTLDINDATSATLKKKVDLLLKNRDHYRALIEQNLPEQIQHSHNAIEAIRDMHDKTTV